MKETIIQLLDDAVAALKQRGELPADVSPTIKVDPARDKAHGDYATNLALVLAKPVTDVALYLASYRIQHRVVFRERA